MTASLGFTNFLVFLHVYLGCTLYLLLSSYHLRRIPYLLMSRWCILITAISIGLVVVLRLLRLARYPGNGLAAGVLSRLATSCPVHMLCAAHDLIVHATFVFLHRWLA